MRRAVTLTEDELFMLRRLARTRPARWQRVSDGGDRTGVGSFQTMFELRLSEDSWRLLKDVAVKLTREKR